MATLAAPLAPRMQTVAQIESATRPQRFSIVLVGCFIVLFGVTYLQRIGYVMDETSQVSLSMSLPAISYPLFYVSGLVQVSATRLMLYCASVPGPIVTLVGRLI